MEIDEFIKKYMEWERYHFFLAETFVRGADYVIKNQVWIEWEFERFFKRMSDEEKEKRIKEFIKLMKDERKDGEQ